MEIDQHPLPKPDELFAALTGGHKFTVLDLSQAYQQLKLQRSMLQLIHTRASIFIPICPSGWHLPPQYFKSTLQGIPKVLCYIDDILITGADDKEHLSNLAEVLNRLEAHSIKLKKAK